MSKTASIRKKALEHAKKRNWDKALQEFIRLAEIENHNPNVFNELGDIYLKVGKQREAFGAFHSAIDAYSEISLNNNAVAVCKKVLRLNPNDHLVYGKLARLRSSQGFHKEAESYSIKYLDATINDPNVNPEDLKDQLVELGNDMSHSAVVLERVSEYLEKWEFNEEAVAVLKKLGKAYSDNGMTTEGERVRERLTAAGADLDEGQADTSAEPGAVEPGVVDIDVGEVPGVSDTVQPATAAGGASHTATATDNSIQTVADDASNTETAEETNATVDSISRSTETKGEDGDASQTSVGEKNQSATTTVELDRPTAPDDVAPSPAPASEPPEVDLPSPTGRPANEAKTASEAPPDVSGDKVWIPNEEIPDGLRKSVTGDAGEVVDVSAIVGQFENEVSANIDVEDYRSHYDLGMAYLEMDLLSEAIREFQTAANSSIYQVRSLEMIGRCFLKQNQPRLAIKQLEKGLSLTGSADREALGLLYNLGLAYEMTGDVDKAKNCFEDVYVVDVSFRDVEEKMQKYSS